MLRYSFLITKNETTAYFFSSLHYILFVERENNLYLQLVFACFRICSNLFEFCWIQVTEFHFTILLNLFELVWIRLNSGIRFIEFMELVMNDLMKYFYKYCPTPVAQWLRRQSKLLADKGSCLTCLGMGTPNILL